MTNASDFGKYSLQHLSLRDHDRPHGSAEDSLALLQLRYSVCEKSPLSLSGRILQRNRHHISIAHFRHDNRREYKIKPAQHLPFDHLCGDVGNKDLLLDLQVRQQPAVLSVEWVDLPCRSQGDCLEHPGS